MAQTSANFQSVKAGSEQHNKREKKLDYVHKELSHNNEYWESCTQEQRIKELKKLVKEKSGRKMQKNASPIWEAVVVIDENTTMDKLHKLADELHQKFGMNCFQIAIHRDEGYKMSKDKIKLNLHAHMVFDWIDHETGRAMHYNRTHMAQIQTIVANTLDMERGQSSDKKHKTPQQYKAEKEAEEAMKRKQVAEEQARKAEANVVEKKQEQKELEDKNTTLRKEMHTMWMKNLELSGQRSNLAISVYDQKKELEKINLSLFQAQNDLNSTNSTLKDQKRLISQKNDQLKQIEEGITLAKSFDNRISRAFNGADVENSLWGVAPLRAAAEECEKVKNEIETRCRRIEDIIEKAVDCIAGCITDMRRRAFSSSDVKTIDTALGKSRREERAECILEEAEEKAEVKHGNYAGHAIWERDLKAIARGEQVRTIDRGRGLRY